MESFRLKNIIILILALMNLCLLGLLGVRLTTGYSAQAEARQQMVQLFAAEGVSPLSYTHLDVYKRQQ